MKKFISIILAIVFILTLSSCKSNSETKDNDTSIQNDTSLPVEVENNQEKSSEINDVNLDATYENPAKNIVIDVPNYQKISRGYTYVYILNGYKYVAVTANRDEQASSLENAHNIAFDLFKEEIQNDSLVQSINITKDSTEKINGIEVYKYEGTLNCYLTDTKSYDAYCIGYSFIMDDTPCTLIGSVIDREQKQEDIDEMRKMVEASIKTLRSER